MPPRDTVWSMDPQTRGKHLVLREYLNAWLPILGQTQPQVLFIDGFAGPGEYTEGDDGSPVIALRAALEHAALERFRATLHFVFIEAEEARSAHLKALLAIRFPTLPPGATCRVVTGKFDETVSRALTEVEAAQKVLAPAFVMVDPFGVSDTPMSVLRRLLRNPKCELYISLMAEFIDRFRGTPEFEPHLDELFGTRDWRKALGIGTEVERRAVLFNLYRGQLQAAGARHVLHFELYRGNNLVYAIFFATKDDKGCTRMKQAIWKVMPFGDYAFRAARSTALEGQLGLELGTTDISGLRDQLRAEFGADWTSIEDLQQFIRSDRTLFHEGHLKQKTLASMENEGLLSVEAPAGRRRGTFPPGTKIRFH